MNQEQEARARRNHVSNMYDGPLWKERVANMPSDQVLAIYLRSIRDGHKPKASAPPEPEVQTDEEEGIDQLEMF